MIVLLMEINDYVMGREHRTQYDNMARRTFGRCHLAIDVKQYCEIYLLYQSVWNRDTFQYSSYNLYKF